DPPPCALRPWERRIRFPGSSLGQVSVTLTVPPGQLLAVLVVDGAGLGAADRHRHGNVDSLAWNRRPRGAAILLSGPRREPAWPLGGHLGVPERGGDSSQTPFSQGHAATQTARAALRSPAG